MLLLLCDLLNRGVHPSRGGFVSCKIFERREAGSHALIFEMTSGVMRSCPRDLSA